MNILFIIGIYPNFGGTERMTTILANNFSSMGYNVCIASFEQKCPELLSDLKNVRFFPLTKPVNSKQNLGRLRSIITTNRIDFIINQWCLPFYVTRLLNRARKNTNARIISVLHGVPNRSKKLIQSEDLYKQSKGIKRLINFTKLKLTDKLLRHSIRYVYNKTECYVVLSESFVNSFKHYTGIKDISKLRVIGNPISIPTDYATDYTVNKEPMILYVGRMDMENKRVNRIIEAWRILSKRFPTWRLELVGDGPHRQQLEALVADNKIERVNFAGFLKEDPIEYYKKASILMLTSDLEGFGLVIIEGMSYGVVPVVYGSYLSIYDIITNGNDGFITTMPYSMEKTVDAVSKLIKSPDIITQMSYNAVETSKKFKVENIFQKWNELLEDISKT